MVNAAGSTPDDGPPPGAACGGPASASGQEANASMLTLHLYLGRELLKTFLMTSVALTLLIVMGGGVANIFRGEGIGAEDMAKVFLFLTPVAVTLVLPVAALFGAAITYGRAAADNEILACRAAGINIHRLLLSAFLLGLFVTVFTYWSWNYLLPSLSRQVEELTRRDLPGIVRQQFQKAKPLSFGAYRMTARGCSTLTAEQLGRELPADHTYLQLTGVAFCETEDQDAVRFGTADVTIVDFDRTETIPRVTVDLQGVRSFDAQRRQYYELEHQLLGPFQIPLPMRRKIKFETLGKLLEYRRDPRLDPEIGDLFNGLRKEMMSHFLYQEVVRNLDPDLGGGGTYRLSAEGVQYDISAEQFAVDPEDGRPTLRTVRVVEKNDQGHGQVLTAETASVELRSGLDRVRQVIIVELVGNVEIRRDPPTTDARVVRKPKETLKPVLFAEQPALEQQLGSLDIDSLLDPTSAQSLRPRQEKLRGKVLTWLARFKSEVQGEIHFRASYSLCTVAIVLFGAVLGIIVRGGQVLTAFGISCLPMLFVVVASIVGRNLADRPAYATLSISVMWAAALIMYLATGFVAMKGLKR